MATRNVACMKNMENAKRISNTNLWVFNRTNEKASHHDQEDLSKIGDQICAKVGSSDF